MDDAEKLRSDFAAMVTGMNFTPRPENPEPPVPDQYPEPMEDEGEPEEEDRANGITDERIQEAMRACSKSPGLKVYVLATWQDYDFSVFNDPLKACRALADRGGVDCSMYEINVRTCEKNFIGSWNNDGEFDAGRAWNPIDEVKEEE